MGHQHYMFLANQYFKVLASNIIIIIHLYSVERHSAVASEALVEQVS